MCTDGSGSHHIVSITNRLVYADFSGKKGSRMPAFTIIGASEKSLVARGGSGGIAIWTRLDKDIGPAAYGTSAKGES